MLFSTLHGRTATDNFTVGQANLPNVNFIIAAGQGSHGHSASSNTNGVIGGVNLSGPGNAGALVGQSITVNANTLPQMLAASGGSGTALSAAIDMRVQYVDSIIATKD